MPSTTEKQRRFMAICEHHPSKAKKACPKMTKKQYHEFASKVKHHSAENGSFLDKRMRKFGCC